MGLGDGEGEGSGAGGWNSSVLGCCGNCTNCLCGTFCFPCLLCQNANRLGDSGCLYWILSCFMPCIPLTLLRAKTRAKYDIDGGTCGDVCCACLCGPCVNCQVANELDAHGA